MIGFWTTSLGLGNIFGFLFSSIIIINMHFPWQVAVQSMGVLAIIGVVSIYLFVDRKKKVAEN